MFVFSWRKKKTNAEVQNSCQDAQDLEVVSMPLNMQDFKVAKNQLRFLIF
jgi:hypothetical protein